MPSVPASIFKAYDIRGIVATALTPEVVEQIGRAFGTEALARGTPSVANARPICSSTSGVRAVATMPRMS